MPDRQFSQNIIAWYRDHARDLPWRDTRDPYRIWVAEVMLQQTRVETVIPYYGAFTSRFPDIHSLAAAPMEEILSIWEGLGYYRRAHNLHKTARILVKEHHARLPEDADALQKLPGIGRYTAAAIASIAFGKDTAALDGNIRRVLARHFNIPHPIPSARGKKAFWESAQKWLPAGQGGMYNQALMDLGARICTPRSPRCGVCPVKTTCRARKLGIQESLPARKERAPIPHYQVTAAVIAREGAVLVAKRPPDGLLGGLWEFPGGKQEENETLRECLAREIQEELSVSIEVGEPHGVYDHAYTHYSVKLYSFFCALKGENIQLAEHTEWTWAPLQSLPDLPMGKLDRMIAADLLDSPDIGSHP